MATRTDNPWSPLARVLWILVPLLVIAGVVTFVLWPRRDVFYSDGERTWRATDHLGLRSVLWDDGARVEGLGDPQQDYDPCLSADGQELYFTRGKAGGGADLYVAYRTPDGWTNPSPVPALNSEHDDIGPAIGHDGATLYFYSNRPGGEGMYDLYLARHTADGWQPPENLGPAANTPYNEYDPAVAPDGSHLLFASNRPVRPEEAPDKAQWPATLREGRYENDYDIYTMDLADASAPPRRLAAASSGADDGQPTLSRDGRWLYFASNRAGGQGGYDIWRCRITDPPLAGLMTAENLGQPVNTAAHELDPAVSLEGFGLYFSSNRLARDTWAIYYARSHEVFRIVRTRRLAIGHILGRLSWPLIGLIAALIGLVLTLLALLRLRRRPGVLTSAMMVSLLVHLVALSLFTIWQISERVSTLVDDEARFEVAVSLPDLSESEVSSRLRAALEDLARTDTLALAAERQPEMTAPEPPPPDMPAVALARAEPEPVPQRFEIAPSEERPVDLSEPPPNATAPVETPDLLSPEPEPAIAARPVREAPPTEPLTPRPVALARREPIRPTAPLAPRPEPDTPPRPAAASAESPLRLAVPVPLEPPVPQVLPAPDVARPEPEAAPQDKVVDLSPMTAETPVRPVRAAAEPADRPVGTRPLAAARAEAPVADLSAPVEAPAASAPLTRPVPPTAAIADVAPPAEPADAGPVVPAPTLARGPGVAPADVDPLDALPPALGPETVEQRGPRANGKAEPVPAPRALVVVDRATGPVAADVGPAVAAPSAPEPLRLGHESVAAKPLASEVVSTAPASPAPRVNLEPTRTGAPAMPPAPAGVVDLSDPTVPSPPLVVQGPEPDVVAAPRDRLSAARVRTEAPALVGPVAGAPPGVVDLQAALPADMLLASAVPAGDVLATPVIGDSVQAAALPVPAAVMDDVTPPPAPMPPKEIYRLRTEPDRAAQIEKLGGTPETEEAVRRALAWFTQHQSPDGRWDVDGFQKHHEAKGRRADGGGQRRDQDVGVTGLAALAFVGAGHTHVAARGAEGPTEYADTVRKAIDWLLAGQKADGDLRRSGQMYDHCLATMVLAESFSMTGDDRLVDPIRRAVAFILKAQNPNLGWRYAPRADNDTSVLGWALMALKSAEIAGFAVPQTAYRGAGQWLDRVAKGKHKGLYEYQQGRKPSPAMTAEGLFSAMLIEYNPASPRTSESVRYVLDHEPRYVPQDQERTNFYYWYYATLALHQLGGPEWDEWNRKVREALVSSQRDDGPFAGSWDTRTRWGSYGGRVYTTAMATLTLEVYYRYLPFYDLRLGEAPADPAGESR